MFNVPDPLAKFDYTVSRLGGAGQERAEYRKPFSPEEMKPLTESLIDYGQSGLRKVFDTLSIPGDYTRGLLGGTPGSRVTGRQLTDRWGLTDRNDKGWGSWGLGLATDAATDPLTYAAFGAKRALTPLGSVLSKSGGTRGLSREAMLKGFDATESGLAAAGHGPDAVAHLMRGGTWSGIAANPMNVATAAQEQAVQKALGRGIVPGERLGGMVGFGLPFMGPQVTFGGGKLGQLAARGLDRTGDFLRFGNPVGRFTGSLFDSTRMGAIDEASQRGYSKVGYPKFEEAQAGARGAQFKAIEALEPVFRQFPGEERKILHVARALGEDATTGRFDPAMIQSIRTHVGSQFPDYYRGEGYIPGRLSGQDITDWGKPQQQNYMRRSLLYGKEDQLQPKFSLFPTHMSIDAHREQLFNQKGGTPRVDEWAMAHSGFQGSHKPVTRDIFQNMYDDAKEWGQAHGAPFNPTLSQLKEMRKQAMDVAGIMKGLSPAHVLNNEPLFTPDLVGDIGRYGHMFGRKDAAAHGLYGAITHAAENVGGGQVNQATHYTVPEVLRQMGFMTHNADPSIGVHEIHGAMPEVLKMLAPKGAAPAEAILRQKDQGPIVQALSRFGVRRELLDDFKRSYAKAQLPEQLSEPRKYIDSFNNLFKALAYPIWPASHGRNATTAALSNLREGVPGFGDYAGQAALLREPGLGASAATRAKRLEQFQHGNIGAGIDSTAELSGMNTPTRLRTGNRITMEMPLADRVGPTGNVVGDIAHLGLKEGALDTARALGSTALSIAGKPWSPSRWSEAIGRNLGVKGVLGKEHDALPAVHAGRVAGSNVEDFFRGSQFNALTRKGYTPEEAGRLVNETHFDYAKATDFERNVMRRVFPFYTFMRNNIPLQARILATRPGISMAQMYPAMQDRHDKPYIPDYLAGNVSIPLGPGSEPGHQKFIGQLGLPIEEAFSRFSFSGGAPDWKKTAQGFLGNASPLIKYPLETAFDTQLFSGRKLSDLKAPSSARALGRVFGEDNPQALSQMMANTPFSRFFTTADRLADPRKTWLDKALNLTTGVKVTDVDVGKQKAIEARDALNQILAGSPHLSVFPSWYVKPEYRNQLTPEETFRMRELATMEKAARDYVEQKKRGTAGQGAVPLQ